MAANMGTFASAGRPRGIAIVCLKFSSLALQPDAEVRSDEAPRRPLVAGLLSSRVSAYVMRGCAAMPAAPSCARSLSMDGTDEASGHFRLTPIS